MKGLDFVNIAENPFLANIRSAEAPRQMKTSEEIQLNVKQSTKDISISALVVVKSLTRLPRYALLADMRFGGQEHQLPRKGWPKK